MFHTKRLYAKARSVPTKQIIWTNMTFKIVVTIIKVIWQSLCLFFQLAISFQKLYSVALM